MAAVGQRWGMCEVIREGGKDQTTERMLLVTRYPLSSRVSVDSTQCHSSPGTHADTYFIRICNLTRNWIESIAQVCS